MKSSALLLAVAALTLQLSACVSTDREMASSSQDPRAVYTPPTTTNRISSQTVLNTVRTTHNFSSTQQPDNFELQLRGTRVLTAMAHLTVTNAKGDTIRHEVMPARALLNERLLDDPQAATVRDKEIAILQGMNAFFGPDRFVQPAVPAGAPQPAEVDTQLWADLRTDPTAVAFDYPSMEGAGHRLAYVRKTNKTLVINQ